MSCRSTASGFPCEGVSDTSIEMNGGLRLGHSRPQPRVGGAAFLVAAPSVGERLGARRARRQSSLLSLAGSRSTRTVAPPTSAGLNGTQVLPNATPECPSVHLGANADLRIRPKAQFKRGAGATFAM
jgi:hypothetical protein